MEVTPINQDSQPNPKTRVYRGRTFWVEHVAAWEQSELTQSAYCRDHGICYRQFSQWKSRLKREQQILDSPDDPQAFVSVAVESETGATPSFSIHLPNGIVLNLPPSGNHPGMVELIKQLAVLPC